MVDLQLYYKPKYMQNNNTYTIFDFDKNLSNMPMDAEAINKFIATSDHFKEIFGIGNFYNTIGIDDINLLYKFYIALLNTEATSQYKIHNNISSSDLNNFICHSSNGYEVIMASEYSVEIQDCCYKPKLSMKTDSNTSMLLTPKGGNWVDIIHYYTNLPREEAICFLAQLLHINWNNLTCYSNDPYYRGCDHHRSYSPESFRDPIWDKAIDDITLTDHFDIIGTNGLIVSRILQYKWGEQEFCIVEPIRKGATTLGQFRPQAHFYNEDKFEKFSRAKVIFAQDMRVARILQKKLEQQSSDPRKFIVTAILGYDLSPFKWNFLRGHDVIFVPAPTPESLSFVKSVYKKCVDHRASSFKISKKFLLRGKSPDIGDSPNFVNRLEQYIAENSLFIEEETFIEATLDELTNTSLKYNKFKKIFYNIGLFCQSDEDSQMLSNSTMKVIPLDPRLTPKNAYKLSDVTGNHIYKPENLVMVSGLKESGKTQITYLLARSALQIEDKIIPFNKFSTASLGNICIVDYETLPNELDGNLHQHELDKFRDSKLFVLSRLADKLPQSLESFDLTDETFRNALTEYITDHDCKLLILDNLTGLMGEKIDQGTAANTVLRWMDSLQQRNICVIFVMHQSIDAAKNDRDRNRGSRLFKDRARVIINFHGVKEINAAKEDDKFYPEEVRELAKSPGLTFGIQFTAFKTAPVFTDYTVWIHLPFEATWEPICITNGSGEIVDASEVIAAESDLAGLIKKHPRLSMSVLESLDNKSIQILKCLSDLGGEAQIGQVADMFSGQKGFGRDTIRKILKDNLAEMGLIEITGSGNYTSYKILG